MFKLDLRFVAAIFFVLGFLSLLSFLLLVHPSCKDSPRYSKYCISAFKKPAPNVITLATTF